MKFCSDSDEETCSAACHHHEVHGWMACLRRKGHEGEHVALMRDAADADGVEFCCRVPLGARHTPDCWKFPLGGDP